MATQTEIENTVTAWIGEILPDREVQIEDSDLPPPSTPYVSFIVSSILVFPYDEKTYSQDNLSETLRGLSQIEIKVSVWDGAAIRDATRLRISLTSDFSLYSIYSLMGRSEIGNVINLTGDYEAKRRARAEFTIKGYTNLNETFDTGYFDRIDIDGVTIGTNNPPASRDTTGC